MESPDEYLGRLNFLGTLGFSTPLREAGMGGARCVCVCVVRLAPPPPPSPLILPQYLFILTLSAWRLQCCERVYKPPSVMNLPRLPGACLSRRPPQHSSNPAALRQD